MPTNPVEVFYSYAHEDEALRDELKKQLASLKRQGLISEWYDRDISPGNEWNEEIEKHLNSASVILLLISPDFIDSDYCNDVEVKRAMERHEEGSAKVIPVILRATNWKGLPFSKLQALPTDGRAVTSWPNQDEAFLDIATGIETAINELNSNSTPGSSSQLSPLAYIEPESAIGFVARKDRGGHDLIEQLRAELAPRTGRVVALWGAGGVGKTALAAQAVRSLIDDYHQRVAWISADGRDEFALPNLLDEISNQLSHPEVRTLELEAKKQAVYALVIESSSLIVFDNFETVSPREQPHCLNWLTHLSPSSVLITTRAKIELPAIRNIPIKSMLASEANEFLDRLVQQAQHRRTFEHIDKDRLIATAEANPLILQWVFAQIDLAQDWREVLDELAQGEGDAAHRVFDRSFNLPLLNNGGRAALLALSLFVPSASRSALAEVAGLSGDKNKRKFKEATKHLSALWLIRTTEEGTRLMVEGLTRDLAKARLGSDQRSTAIRQRFIERFASFAEKNSKNTFSDFNALENEKQNLFSAIDVAFATKNWEIVFRLYLSIWSFMSLRGYWDEAIARGEKAKLAASEKKHKYALATVTQTIANISSDRGDYVAAAQMYHEVLQVFRDLKTERGIAHTLSNLGLLQSGKGDFQQAKLLHRESLDIFERLGDENGIGRERYCLGRIAHVEGMIDEAGRLFTSSLEFVEKSGSQRDIPWSVFGLGELDHEQGATKKARQKFLDALEIHRKLGNQTGTVTLLGALSAIARQEGRMDEALRLCNESLEIAKRLGNQQGYVYSLYQLGLLALDQGKLVEARHLFEQSLEITRRLGDLLSIGSVLHELANVECSEGALDTAESLIDQSLSTLRKLGAKRYLALALNSLGRLRTAQGSFPEAGEAFREGLEIAETLGQKPAIARIKHSAGLLAEKENDLSLATTLFRESLELYESLGFAKAATVRADFQRLEHSEQS